MVDAHNGVKLLVTQTLGGREAHSALYTSGLISSSFCVRFYLPNRLKTENKMDKENREPRNKLTQYLKL